jgi:hypothetical protein
MRMATLIMPLFDNDGHAIPQVHDAIADKLLNTFGGYSKVKIEGSWRDPQTGRIFSDRNVEYRIAMDDTPSNRGALARIAEATGRAASQLEVLITQPNGDVEFINTRPLQVAA